MLYEIFVKKLVSAILDDIVEYICMTYHCEIELVLLFRREVTTAHSFADFEFSSSLKIALTRSLIDVVVWRKNTDARSHKYTRAYHRHTYTSKQSNENLNKKWHCFIYHLALWHLLGIFEQLLYSFEKHYRYARK